MWAVGSYSSGPPDMGTFVLMSTEYRNKGDVSPCTYCSFRIEPYPGPFKNEDPMRTRYWMRLRKDGQGQGATPNWTLRMKRGGKGSIE